MIQLIKIYHQIGFVFLLQYLYLCSGTGCPSYIRHLQFNSECSVSEQDLEVKQQRSYNIVQ